MELYLYNFIMLPSIKANCVKYFSMSSFNLCWLCDNVFTINLVVTFMLYNNKYV